MKNDETDDTLKNLEEAQKRVQEIEEFLVFALILYLLPEDYKVQYKILIRIFPDAVIKRAKELVDWNVKGEKILREIKQEFKEKTKEMALQQKMEFLRENIPSIKKMVKEKLRR